MDSHVQQPVLQLSPLIQQPLRLLWVSHYLQTGWHGLLNSCIITVRQHTNVEPTRQCQGQEDRLRPTQDQGSSTRLPRQSQDQDGRKTQPGQMP